MKQNVFIVIVLLMSWATHGVIYADGECVRTGCGADERDEKGCCPQKIKKPAGDKKPKDPKPKKCEEGKEVGEYTKGNCCWPGQAWAGKCVGAPECPAGTLASGESCVRSSEMVSVPAGEFWMGCHATDSECVGDEKPGRMVYLDAFKIDKTEVTVDAYAACVNAGICSAPDTTSQYCVTEHNNWGKSGRDNHPVNCVDWFQADAYCRWGGKQLPTEAQWEKAARGTDGRIYPWGNKVASCTHAVMDDGGQGCGTNLSNSVGSKPAGASPYGALDMSGNVWEWTADWYDSGYDASSPSRNPTGPSSGSDRVFRGGGFNNKAAYLRASLSRPRRARLRVQHPGLPLFS